MDDDGASPRADVCGAVERLVVEVCWDAAERSRGRMEERSKVMVSGNIRQNRERKETTIAIIGDS